MKKTTFALLVALIIALLIGFGDAGMEQHPHVCVDLSHATCDGECGCDGLKCK